MDACVESVAPSIPDPVVVAQGESVACPPLAGGSPAEFANVEESGEWRVTLRLRSGQASWLGLGKARVEK